MVEPGDDVLITVRKHPNQTIGCCAVSGSGAFMGQ
jgi:hypothetical protein